MQVEGPGCTSSDCLRQPQPEINGDFWRISAGRINGSSRHRVRILVDEVRQAGNYQIQWNGTNDGGQQISSGVYVCCMQAGSFRETRRMTLLK
jgi:hypothetical protein